MKKIKTLCAVCAMAMCFSTLSVTASAEETSGGAALTREQCNKIVETAIEEYHIVVRIWKNTRRISGIWQKKAD